MSSTGDFIIENGILKRYVGPGGDVIIPEGVTSIGYGAFYMCSTLHSITIPRGVTSIEKEAFEYCKALNSITIPEGVMSIGHFAFSGCSSLTSVTIPQGMKGIGRSAFSNCSNLTSVMIPDSVMIIGNNAFCNCMHLMSVTLPTGLRSIGDEAFFGCPNLTVTIPDGLKYIAEHPYDGNSKILIDDINRLPPALRPNAAVGFAVSNGEKEAPGFDNHCKYIKANAAKLVGKAIAEPALLTMMCRKRLITPKNVQLYVEATQRTGNAELIAMMLDYQATKVSDKQKEGVQKRKDKEQERIEERFAARQDKIGIEGLNITVTGKLVAFANRNELKSFIQSKGGKLLSSLTADADYLIMNDMDADTLNVKKAQELGIEIVTEQDFLELAGSAFFVDGEKLIRYLGNDREVVVPDTITGIGDKAFMNCRNMESVTIPERITDIGEWAFAHCTGLKTVVIPDGVTRIKYSTFRDCSSLTEAAFPRGLKTIEDKAFYECSSLINAHIPGSVISIGEEAFFTAPA